MTQSSVSPNHIVPERMDTFIVACDRDVKLLRHFFLSYELFFRSPGRIYLFIWKKEKQLLDIVRRPNNLVVLYKDDVSGLGEDDFHNQMYLKMIADRYVETDWFWVPDADYLICSPIQAADFFRGWAQKPRWYYRIWDGGPPEQFWRQGSEQFLCEAIPYLFMDAPEYVLNKNILGDMREHHNPDGLLVPTLRASEFVAYGAFAYKYHRHEYDWINLADAAQPSLAYKVNQRPPTYCELDEDVKLSSIGSAKYAVFWSHWDKCEQKMREFLIDAQMREFGRILVEPDTKPLCLELKTSNLSLDSFIAIDGAYLDGWVKTECAFSLEVLFPRELVLKFTIPMFLAENITRLSVEIGDKAQNFMLNSGDHDLHIPLKAGIDNIISLDFSGGITESNGERRLFAQLEKISLQSCGGLDQPYLETK